MPMIAWIPTTTSPIESEIRMPWIMPAATSRPRRSVPSQCAPDGVANTSPRSSGRLGEKGIGGQ
jgi:hypothetical protein